MSPFETVGGHTAPAEPPALQRLRDEAAGYFRAGRFEEAAMLYRRILAASPKDADSNRKLGVLAMGAGRFDEGRRLVEAALAVNPSDAETWLHHGMALQNLGQLAEAATSYERALALRPDYPEALFTLGVVLRGLERSDEALARFNRFIVLCPDRAAAYLHRGDLHFRKGDGLAALADYESALTLKPDYVEGWLHRGVVLTEVKRVVEALASFDRALALAPDRADILYNRGVALQDLGRDAEALETYERAVTLGPDLANAWNNRGSLLRDAGRLEDALASFQRALALDPRHVEALANGGATLQSLGRHARAMVMFDDLGEAAPQHKYLLGGVLASATALCDWDVTDKLRPYAANVVNGTAIVTPFIMLGLSSDPSLNRACAAHFLRDKQYPPASAKPAPAPHEKIRLAYLSSDFRDHATAHLMAGLFERHDRSRFEIIGVSFGPDEESAMRSRIEAAFDRFHEVGDLSDEEIAVMLRGMDIDIAVDLKGYTEGARTGVLARRVAPVQVNYLGYPGTMAAGFIDYIIADKIVLPHDQQPYYDERIVHLPDSYQANDPARPLGKPPARAAAGLPDEGFVFSCFNNCRKIARPVFDVWMRLLAAVPDSVLWLITDSADETLRHEATARGIDPARLVFAPKVKQNEHLARLGLADLMLDTLPYGAHTTASDALWAGVPLVTCKGNAFAGRVAASLLSAVGLSELIVEDLEACEALALALARDPERLAGLRGLLAANRQTAPLFDADRFARHIEAAFTTMVETDRQGEAPKPFDVPA